MNLLTLTLLVIISAFIHIRAEYAGPRWQVYLFKPLTIVLIIVIALSFRDVQSQHYQLLIVGGLLLSLLGDVFLMFPKDHFIFGLLSFFVAHCIYITAFLTSAEFSLSTASLLPFLLIVAVMYLILRPNLGKMRLPVSVYMIVIAAMAWIACERWLSNDVSAHLRAAIGAILFMISDGILAFERFKVSFRKARFYVLTTYYAAQWFITLSIAESARVFIA